MTNLHPYTWLRLLVWMVIGLVIYFFHGIKHSTLDPESNRVNKNFRQWGAVDDRKHLTDTTADSASICSTY